ncbi:MAG TPA: MBL fold metallo-hydrolase [Bacteroidales bacterium]|nr:MBL fold metallo-hydrolase [Bacteroidales bacterium]
MDLINVIKKVFTLATIMVMAVSLKAQNIPESDPIKTSVGIVEMHFIGHGSLMFKYDGKIIYMDPVKSSGNYDQLPQADVILVTHEHGDHLDAALIEKLKKADTKIFCNNSSVSKSNGIAMTPGSIQEVGTIKIEAVDAYNIEKSFHPKGNGLGFILTFGDKRIYVAGDTENTPEMKALKNIDIAFLPMNLPYTMNPEMVADAAKAFKPKILYPYHYGNTDTNELLKLLEGTGIEVRVRNLK